MSTPKRLYDPSSNDQFLPGAGKFPRVASLGRSRSPGVGKVSNLIDYLKNYTPSFESGASRANLGGPSSAFGGETVKAGPGQLSNNTVAGSSFDDYFRLDRATGELQTSGYKPLPPLTSNSALPGMMNGPEGRIQMPRYEGNPMQEGFKTAIDEQKSFFQPTRKATTGMNLGQRLRYAAGAAAGDIASDATRTQYWRFNHPLAIAREGFTRMAGGSKVGGALASFAGIQALGQTSGGFDLTNPMQAFRPKGMQAAYPADKSLTATENPVKELVGRYLLGRGGKMLPYDQFSAERPDVSRETYDKYDNYLKGKGGPGTFDLGGMGVLKGTSEGINGPEIRFANFPVTPASVAVGTVTAGVTAKAFKGAKANPLGAVQNLKRGAIGFATGLVSEGSSRASEHIAQRVGLPEPVAKGIGIASKFTTDLPGAATDLAWQGAKALFGQRANAASAPKVAKTAAAAPTSGNQTDADRAYSVSGDRLARASAEFKLVKQKDGSIKSVRRAEGDMEGVRGVVTKVDDGDTYRARVYNRKTGQFDEQNIRVGNIDSRETADHNSSGTFINRMIGKQKKEQGYTSDDAVFRQGEKDKQAAAGLVPVGGVVELRNVGEAAHGRMAATVGQEGSGRDVGNQLVASGNAVAYEKGGKSGGGISGADRIKVAQFQYGAGGSVDRTNQSKIKIAKLKDDVGGSVDRTNQTKTAIADMTTGRNLEGTKYRADATVKVADVTGQRRIQQEGVRQMGQNQTADTTGRYKVQTADVTGQRRIQQEGVRQMGQNQTANTKGQYQVKTAATQGEYKVATEGVRQQGQIQGALIKGDAAIGVANVNAGGRVRVAQLQGIAKADTEGVKQQGQLATQYAKNDGLVGVAQTKYAGDSAAGVRKSNDAISMTRDERQFKADSAHQQYLYGQSNQAQKASQQKSLVAEQGAQQRATQAHSDARKMAAAEQQSESARIATIAGNSEYRSGGARRRAPRLARI